MTFDGTAFPYGLREIKVKRDGMVVAAPAAQTLKFKERLVNAELRGNDRVIVSQSFVDAVEWELSTGGYPLDFIALLTGRTVATDGSGTTETATLTIKAGEYMPYVEIYGRSLGDDGDDVHVKILRAKVNDGVEGTFQDGQFFISAIKGIALAGSDDKIVDVVRNETATALLASTPPPEDPPEDPPEGN